VSRDPKATPPMYPLFNLTDREETPEETRGVKKCKKCWECEVELAPELDAYYGFEFAGEEYCWRCRKKRGII
jgi:hypothetical protein